MIGSLAGIWKLIRGEEQRGRKLRWMAALLRPYRGRVALAFVAMLAATGAGLAPPYLAGQAIDAGIVAGDSAALTLIVAAFLGVALLYAVASFAQTYLVGWVGTRALQDLRERVFAHLQAMSIGFFTRRSPGVLISRMTNDIEALNQLVTNGVVTLFSSGLTLIGAVAIMLALDVRLALVTFLTFPLLAIASVVFRIVSHGAYRLTRERIAAVTAYLQETLSGVRVVRSFGQEPRHAEAMTELNEANRDANMKTVYLNASYFPSVELLTAIGTAAIIVYGGTQAIDNAIQIGTVVAFIGYLQVFFQPIQELSQLYTTYQQGMAALDKVFELLDTEPDMVDAPDAIDPGVLRGEIEMDGVCFAYSGEDWALEGIDLHVPPGQTLALVGATGAGKSTLAKLVARFYDPQRGSVAVDGHDLRGVRQEALRRQLGIVPQEGFLFSGSVRENIAFGRPEASAEEIEAAVAAVGAARVHRGAAAGDRDRSRRARRAALGRPAAARRLRPGAARRAAHPDPRRGDLERRRAHRAHDRARAGAAARRAHRDRHRPPPLDDSPRRQDRRARGRPHRRERRPRGADRRRRPLLEAVRGMGRVLGCLSGPVAKQVGGRREARRGERTPVRDPRRPTEDPEMRRLPARSAGADAAARSAAGAAFGAAADAGAAAGAFFFDRPGAAGFGRRFGFFGRRFFDRRFFFDTAGAFFAAPFFAAAAAGRRRRRRFGALFEAERARRRLEFGQRRGRFGFGRGERRAFFAFGGELDVVLGLRERFRRGDEFGVAGAFFARRSQALQPFDHAVVEAGDLRGAAGSGRAGRADRADRGVDLGADRIPLGDQLGLAQRGRFGRFGRRAFGRVAAPAAATGNHKGEWRGHADDQHEPPHRARK